MIGATGMQKKIIDLLLKGYTNKDIAKELDIKECTVKNYLNFIYLKYGIEGKSRKRVKLVHKLLTMQ